MVTRVTLDLDSDDYSKLESLAEAAGSTKAAVLRDLLEGRLISPAKKITLEIEKPSGNRPPMLRVFSEGKQLGIFSDLKLETKDGTPYMEVSFPNVEGGSESLQTSIKEAREALAGICKINEGTKLVAQATVSVNDLPYTLVTVQGTTLEKVADGLSHAVSNTVLGKPVDQKIHPKIEEIYKEARISALKYQHGGNLTSTGPIESYNLIDSEIQAALGVRQPVEGEETWQEDLTKILLGDYEKNAKLVEDYLKLPVPFVTGRFSGDFKRPEDFPEFWWLPIAQYVHNHSYFDIYGTRLKEAPIVRRLDETTLTSYIRAARLSLPEHLNLLVYTSEPVELPWPIPIGVVEVSPARGDRSKKRQLYTERPTILKKMVDSILIGVKADPVDPPSVPNWLQATMVSGKCHRMPVTSEVVSKKTYTYPEAKNSDL